MTKPQLYNYFRSSTSYRVRIALHLKQIEFEYIPVHLLKNGGEQHSEEYKSLSPLSEVPTLIIDGNTISQSFAIIELLEELHPEKSLFTKNIFLNAKIRQFCENINSFMHPLGNLQVLQYLENAHEYNLEQKEAWVQHWLNKGFSALEKMLKKTSGRFSFGDELTAADVFLIPQIFTAERFKVQMDRYPLCMKINSTCQQLDCFKKAHPLRQMDTPTDLKLID